MLLSLTKIDAKLGFAAVSFEGEIEKRGSRRHKIIDANFIIAGLTKATALVRDQNLLSPFWAPPSALSLLTGEISNSADSPCSDESLILHPLESHLLSHY
jgi:hypothetical protein